MGKQKYPASSSSSTSAESGKRGRENYSAAKLHAKRDAKRQAAEDRQSEYDDLSVAERITRAQGRRGKSKHEISRLQEKLPVTKTTKNEKN